MEFSCGDLYASHTHTNINTTDLQMVAQRRAIPPTRSPKPTILVIDDDVPTLELLLAAFSLEDYTVIDAVNGREGLRRLEIDRPDIVLCDVLMPDIDGRGFSEAMHKQADFKHIPLVLVSAGQETRVAAGIEYTAFVEKPFSVGALIDLVKNLLERAHVAATPGS